MLTVGHASVRVRSIQPVRLAVSGMAAICAFRPAGVDV
jgi:hypothetical protein